jgi:hypothetical protein
MIGSLWVGRRGAPSKEGFDHVGDDGTRLGEVEGGDGRIHLGPVLSYDSFSRNGSESKAERRSSVGFQISC